MQVVWVPMLDNDELPSAIDAAKMFASVPEYWDGGKRLADAVAKSVAVDDWNAWDIYLFYRPGKHWTSAGSAMPAPDAVLVQSHGMVVASKGALPPIADQSTLSPRFRDRAEVVGGPTELEPLLAKLAARFTIAGDPPSEPPHLVP